MTSAQSMAEAVFSRASESDLIIKAAAVADYTPVEMASEKIKKTDGEFQLTFKADPGYPESRRREKAG